MSSKGERALVVTAHRNGFEASHDLGLAEEGNAPTAQSLRDRNEISGDPSCARRSRPALRLVHHWNNRAREMEKQDSARLLFDGIAIVCDDPKQCSQARPRKS